MTDPSQPGFFSTHIARARRFHLGVGVPGGLRLRVVCGGCERCAADYAIHRTRFPYLAIEFVAGGEGQLKLNGRASPLTPGTIFSYGPRVAHDIVTDARKRLIKYFVDFTGRQASRLLRAAGIPPGRIIRTSAPDEMMTLFDDLVRNGLKHTRYSPRICAALLEAILLKIAETRIPRGSVESGALATYQDCVQRIEQHALEIRTLGDISRDCHIHPAYLCRLFHRFGHETPYQFLLRLKMNHAAGRLLAPGMLVKQVAAEMGFDDPYHFSRTFKSVFGVSPAQFVHHRRAGAGDAFRAPSAHSGPAASRDRDRLRGGMGAGGSDNAAAGEEP